MKKKTVVKILLDIAMLALLALMYSAHALGLAFHEIGGLALIGAFFLHKGLNFEWIRRVTARLFRADGRTRLLWVVDALMLLSFLAVGVSGILISKIAFPGLAAGGGTWKAIHYGSAALSLMLTGVHMGLHLNFLKGVLSRWVRLPRVVAALVTVALMAYGVYGMASTSFVRWMTMPFTASAQGGEGFGKGRGQFPGAGQTTDTSANSAQTASADPARTGDDASAQVDSENSDGVPTHAASADTAQPGAASAQNSGAAMRGFGGDRGGRPGSFGSALNTLAQYFSIAFLFAALTALIDIALRRKTRRARAS